MHVTCSAQVIDGLRKKEKTLDPEDFVMIVAVVSAGVCAATQAAGGKRPAKPSSMKTGLGSHGHSPVPPAWSQHGPLMTILVKLTAACRSLLQLRKRSRSLQMLWAQWR